MEWVDIELGKEPGYEMKESLRTLRTNIAFCGADVRVIMFTSSMPDEGKSTVVFNLANALADSDKKVLIVDSDMRKSVLINRYHASRPGNEEILGLSHYLSGQCTLKEILYQTNVNRVYMTFAGPSVPNPTEMLEREEFEKFVSIARKNFDYILIDCAPLGAAIDAAVVARVCDGAIMVVEQGVVGAKMVVENKKQLEASGVRILGAILNKVKMDGTGYYGHYYKKYYGKYYGKYKSGPTDKKKNRKADRRWNKRSGE